MIRPELRDSIWRWREVLTAAAIALAGLWWATATTGFFRGLAALVVLGALALGWIGMRRLRFAQAPSGPGRVQVVEGQISYFGPETGGFVALRDMSELHLVEHGRAWLLVSEDDVAVTIPVGAQGAEALFDAFGSLDGIDMQALLRARNAPDPPRRRMIWAHPARLRTQRALT